MTQDFAVTSRRAVFLDRDGVINVDTGYPHRPEQLVLTPTAAAAVARINRAGVLAVVATNQSGVARGLFTLDEVERFHQHLNEQLSRRGARIDAFYVAPYLPGGSVPEFAIEHEDRKPGPGMILRALRDWRIDPGGSVLIGDKPSDAEAARRAGVPAILVEPDTCDLDSIVASWLKENGKEQGPDMHSPGAMRTTFDEGGEAPTRVIVMRDLVEQETGRGAVGEAEFADWIDRNADRILASALARRQTRMGLEEVVLGTGDLLPPTPHDDGGLAPPDEQEEVRVVALGEPIDSVDPLFVGNLGAAIDYVMARDTEWQEEVCIAAPGRIYGADEFQALADELASEDERR